MPKKIVESDGWRERFKLLHPLLGVRRDDLYGDLGDELRALWKIVPGMTVDDQRRAVASELKLLMEAWESPSGEITRDGILRSLRVSYNVSGFKEVEGIFLGRRQKWLADGGHGYEIVSSPSSRGYVRLFIAHARPLIEAQLKAAGIIPNGDTIPEPPDEPPLPVEVKDEQESTTQAAEPSTNGEDSSKAEPNAPSQHPEPGPHTEEPQQTFTVSTEAVDKVLDPENWSTAEDDALAVLALGGGRRGMEWAGKNLFRVRDDDGNDLGHDYLRHVNAIKLARKRGINRDQVLIARSLCAERGSLAIESGRVDHVASGLSSRMQGKRYRLNKEYALLQADRVVANEYQRISLEKGGRPDLGGDWLSPVVMNHAEDLLPRLGPHMNDTALSCAVLFDGLRKATLDQLITAHPFAITCISYTARVLFKHGTVIERLAMATWVLELATARNRTSARGNSQESISQLLFDLREFGISTSRDPAVLANQLAVVVGPLAYKPDFTGADLIAHSRL
ncbi:hypothetical protein ABH935_007169 [Catenulispora sp. GAS73]|uniref:hypothetical protein n=1 Tax=Catenulispora sp. GAS73 TaxID=3156269 RepID=UPI003518FFB0